jgi:hypothetical protein
MFKIQKCVCDKIPRNTARFLVSAAGGVALLSEFLNFLHAYCVHAHATAMHRMKANGLMTTVTT